MEESDLDNEIKQAVSGKIGGEGGAMDFAGDLSAIEKAKKVISEVEKRGWDTNKMAFMSIGGADGTELDYELRNTESSHGVLLEWDDQLSEGAAQKAQSLKEVNKEMKIFTGDARQKIKTALAWIDNWKDNKDINCMIVTIFALLHEFPYRGNRKSDLIPFLGKLYRKDIGVLIVAREPFMPTNLPKFVTVSAKCDHSRLESLANYIREKHSELSDLGEITVLANGVRMPARIAIDTIFKLPHLKSLQYEIEELATFYKEEDYLTAFRHAFGSNALDDASMQSGSYHKLYEHYGVKLTDDESKPLGIPRSHLRLIVQVSMPPANTSVQASTPKTKIRHSSGVKGELVCVFREPPHQKQALSLAPNLWHCPRTDEKYSCLTVQYNYKSVKKFPIQEEKGLCRYLPLLPVDEIKYSLNEGRTALFSNKELSKRLGIDKLFFKDEGRNPTGSFKDRKTIIDINYALAINATSLHCITSSNSGVSLATYGRMARLTTKHYLVNYRRSLKPESKYIKHMGGEIYRDPDTYKIPSSLEPTSSEINCTPGYDPIGMEGYKVIAWEIWEELGYVPDVVVIPVGSGEGLFGVFKGFLELKEMNLVDKIPQMLGVEPSECGILTQTKHWKNEPYAISDTDPNLIWKSHADQLVLNFMPCVRLVLWAIEQSEGNYVAVSNNEIEEALDLFINDTGLMIEPSSAVVIAALQHEEIKCDPKDTVVVIITGRGERYLYETLQLAKGPKRENLVSIRIHEGEVYIKKADLTDYREILPLYNDLIKRGDTTLSVSPIFVDDEAMFFADLGESECVFAARMQNNLIGYGLLLEYRRDLGCSPHIAEADMYFWPESKSQAVEDVLINEMIRYAAEKGYHKVVHECRSVDNISAYKKVGFNPIAQFEHYYKHGQVVDKIMVLELPTLKKITE